MLNVLAPSTSAKEGRGEQGRTMQSSSLTNEEAVDPWCVIKRYGAVSTAQGQARLTWLSPCRLSGGSDEKSSPPSVAELLRRDKRARIPFSMPASVC